MRNAPPPGVPAPRVLVAGFSSVIAVAVLCGCGGGMSTRVAAEPAVRLDRPAAAAKSTVVARSSGFQEAAVQEESFDDAGPEQPAAGGRDDADPAPERREGTAVPRDPRAKA